MAPHGVRGTVRAEILTDFPERLAKLETVYVGRTRQRCHIESTRWHRSQVLLKLAGVDTVEQAEGLRGDLVYVPLAEAVPLPAGQYYWHQIIDLDVQTSDGQPLGRISDILRTGSNDVYVVRSGDKELLIPAIEDVVKEIDLAEGRMIVEPIPGLLE